MKEMKSLWGVPFYHESSFFTRKNFNNGENEIFDKLLQREPKRGVDGVWVISDNGKLLERKKLSRIRKIIDIAAQRYRKEIICMKQDIRLTASWMTINNKGDHHERHNHQHSFFTVCYYPQAESGKLFLHTENRKNAFQRDYNFGLSYTRMNQFNCGSWGIPVKSGDIVIFPSWVEHDTSINESDTQRWMIGANYWIKGEVSSYGDLDRISI